MKVKMLSIFKDVRGEQDAIQLFLLCQFLQFNVPDLYFISILHPS